MRLPLWTDFEYKPHQVIGVDWMVAREAAPDIKGGILADEMGLGKTIEMLGLIKADARPSHSLLLAPVAVLNQWEETARKANITVLRLKTTAKHLSWEIQGTFRPRAPKLYIIGYETAANRTQILFETAWDRVICDEAQRIVSGNSFFKLVAEIPTTCRWFLSATPVVNSIKDLAHLFELLGVEDAGTVTDSLITLNPLVKELVLARSMDQLRASIPDAPPKPVTEHRSLPFLTEEEGEFYRGISGVIVKKWKALDADGGGSLMKLQLFMKLRQLSLHPQVYIDARKKKLGNRYERPDWTGSSTKFEAIKNLIQSHNGETHPHKWIVFCHFHPEMQLLQKELQACDDIRSVSIYNGTLSYEARKRVLDKTMLPLPNSNKADVLLVQLQSGGVGLNLQQFDRIIFSGPWWTSALMQQAVGRAVRIGQKEVVIIYHITLKEEEAMNIDSVMTKKAEEKGQLCASILAAANTRCA